MLESARDPLRRGETWRCYYSERERAVCTSRGPYRQGKTVEIHFFIRQPDSQDALRCCANITSCIMNLAAFGRYYLQLLKAIRSQPLAAFNVVFIIAFGIQQSFLVSKQKAAAISKSHARDFLFLTGHIISI